MTRILALLLKILVTKAKKYFSISLKISCLTVNSGCLNLSAYSSAYELLIKDTSLLLMEFD